MLGLGTTVAVIGSGMTAPFGYPTWQGLAVEILKFTLKLSQGGKQRLQEVKRLLEDVETYLRKEIKVKKPNKLSQNTLMFLIGSCKKILQRNNLKDNTMRLSGSYSERVPELSPNAFGALLKLPIKRFITTNYDCEIERALD